MQPVRKCQGQEKDFKYTASHIMFMAKQQGTKLLEVYFKFEASQSTLKYGLCKGLELFGEKGYWQQ